MTPLEIRDRSRPAPRGYFLAENEGTGLLDWEPTARRFAASRNYWVSTASRTGRPHAMPVWVLWLDDRFQFSTSPAARKARNLNSIPRAALDLEDGNAVIVIEGRAAEIADSTELLAFLAIYNPKYAWNFTLDQLRRGVYAMHPETAFAWLGSEGESFGGTASYMRGRAILPEIKNPFKIQTAVANENVNLRSGPTADSDKIGLVTKNSKVKIVNSQNNWYQVDVIEQGQAKNNVPAATRGWLNGKFLDIDNN